MKKNSLIMVIAFLAVLSMVGCDSKSATETSLGSRVSESSKKDDVDIETDGDRDDAKSEDLADEINLQSDIEVLLQRSDEELLAMTPNDYNQFLYLYEHEESRGGEVLIVSVCGLRMSSSGTLYDTVYRYEVVSLPTSVYGNGWQACWGEGNRDLKDKYTIKAVAVTDRASSDSYVIYKGDRSDYKRFSTSALNSIRLLIVPGNYHSVQLENTNMERIVIGEGVKSITLHGDNLKAINIPASVTENLDIGGGIQKRNEELDLVVTVVQGSYGEQYCKDNGFRYVYKE